MNSAKDKSYLNFEDDKADLLDTKKFFMVDQLELQSMMMPENQHQEV